MLQKETLSRLNNLGIPAYNGLPKIIPKVYRTPIEVAKRINIFAIFLAITDSPDSINFFAQLINEQGMVDCLTQSEKDILSRGTLLKQEEIDISWYQEGLYALCWCLGLTTKFDLLQEEADLETIFPLIPPEVDINQFIQEAKLIDFRLIVLETEFYYGVHWALRHPESWLKYEYEKYSISIIRERRKALEWVIDNSVDWDFISLDT